MENDIARHDNIFKFYLNILDLYTHGLISCRSGNWQAYAILTTYFLAPRQCKKVNVKICEFGDVAYFRRTIWNHAFCLLKLTISSACWVAKGSKGSNGCDCRRTTKDVKRGAELITDYGSEYWEDRNLENRQWTFVKLRKDISRWAEACGWTFPLWGAALCTWH